MRLLSAMLGWGQAVRPETGRRSRLKRPLIGCCCAASDRRGRRCAGASGLDRPAPRKFEIALTVAVLLGAALFGAERGGQLDAVTAQYGGVDDWVGPHARPRRPGGHGFRRDAHERAQDPRHRGLDSKKSLPFFDVAQARARLEADPLIKQASVRKLYPNHIVIEIVERTPYAVWQKDGDVRAIAADGAPIDEVSDNRYADLPFVVGEGANGRVREFVGLLDAMDELKPRVEAGVLVDQRRWNLRLKSGIDVKLPESDPRSRDRRASAPSSANPASSRRMRWPLDFRVPGRVFVRLSEEAAASWADAHAAKKGAQP